jgi:hypothetical protein
MTVFNRELCFLQMDTSANASQRVLMFIDTLLHDLRHENAHLINPVPYKEVRRVLKLVGSRCETTWGTESGEQAEFGVGYFSPFYVGSNRLNVGIRVEASQGNVGGYVIGLLQYDTPFIAYDSILSTVLSRAFL